MRLYPRQRCVAPLWVGLKIITFLPLLLFFLTRSWWIGRKRCHPLAVSELISDMVSTSRFCRIGCHLFGIQIHRENPSRTAGHLIVGNHQGYLDPIAMSACVPAAYVTSRDMGEDPIFGPIIRAAGCIMVDRRNPRHAKDDLVILEKFLRRGLSVVLYPEGTSSDGTKILPFKTALMASAVQIQIPVLPIAMTFTAIDRQRISPRNRDWVCWYGDMTLLSHVWGMFCRHRIHIRFRYGNAVPPQKERRELAEMVRDQLCTLYQPII
jgi:lyso-ornithine lipid O-acyltransferase